MENFIRRRRQSLKLGQQERAENVNNGRMNGVNSKSKRKQAMMMTALAVLALFQLHYCSSRQHLVEQQSALTPTPATNNNDEDDSTKNEDEGRFAYAYIISGCTETSCLGYILNLIAAGHVLRQSGSKAKLVARIRMSASVPAAKLDLQYEKWLQMSGVEVQYLNKVKVDNFGTATLEKFRVMEMTDYDRVLFLDADVLPLCNLDYLFEESYRKDGVLSDFVSVSDSVAPFAGGFFLVTPEHGEFERIMDIVHRHRNRDKNPHTFDGKRGWGHVIAKDDPWKAWFRPGNNWTFYAAWSDQGILYHWLRYERGNYTWLDVDKMERWETVHAKDVAYWENRTHHVVPEIASTGDDDRYIARVQVNKVKQGSLQRGCGGQQLDRRGKWSTQVPFRDYYHFAGGAKPWFKPILAANVTCDAGTILKGHDLWLCTLIQANRTLGLGLPSAIIPHKKSSRKNPLGGGDSAHFPHLLQPDIEIPHASM